MGNNTKFSVLQLSHPGLEYPGLNKKTGSLIYTKSGIAWNSTRDGGIRLWNNLKQHKRKFMRMKNVKYLDKDGQLITGEVTFWGEWEAQSKFELISQKSKNLGEPRLCHQPFFDRLYKGEKKHGTDPFIFGSNFWYTHCKQSYKSARNLSPGSIVIFGSERNKDKKFLVDTILVVEKRFTQKEIRRNLNEFHSLLRINNLEIKNLINDESKSGYGFYRGKSFSQGEIFSFVPAKVISSARLGHGRLELDTEDPVHNFQKTGAGSVCRITRVFNSENELKDYWHCLANESFENGFVLAHNFPMPKFKESYD